MTSLCYRKFNHSLAIVCFYKSLSYCGTEWYELAESSRQHLALMCQIPFVIFSTQISSRKFVSTGMKSKPAIDPSQRRGTG